MKRCTSCGAEALVFPLHGTEKGGPLVCPQCAFRIESSYKTERQRVLDAVGALAGRRPAEPAELSLELLNDALALVHPDRHPPERAELATRVTAALVALRPYVRPETAAARAPACNG